jgi:hypothetical protein
MMLLLAIVLYFSPVFLIGWGWARRPEPLSPNSALSFVGFALATSALLLEIGGVIYAIASGGFVITTHASCVSLRPEFCFRWQDYFLQSLESGTATRSAGTPR